VSKSQKGFIYVCLLSTLISEMLLSPFYPQLFSTYFHVEGVQATSLFICCCRIVVIVMTPIWTMMMKKWGFQQLIPIALVAMGGCKLLFPSVSSFSQFLLLSIVLLFFQSSIYLLYPLLVAACKNDDEKVKGTTTYLFLFHGSVITSGILGSFVINQPLPLNSYYMFALLDLFLAGGSYFYLINKKMDVNLAETKQDTQKGKRWNGEFLIYLFIVLLFYLGHQVIRPYFTIYLEESYRMTKQVLSILYVMPSLAAIILQFLLPKEYLKSHVRVILLVLTTVTGGMMFLHAAIDHMWFMVFIRIFYSICFFVCLIGIDVLFFQLGIGKASPLSYSFVISIQNTALLFAPLSALAMVEFKGFQGPFLLSGILLICASLGMILLYLPTIKSTIYLVKKGVG
jgi:predicted MFS family arabinose efflux permease